MRVKKFRAIAKILLALLLTFAIAINIIPSIFVPTPIHSLDREASALPNRHQKYDVIIVLGYPALEDGRPSPMLAQRVLAAIDLYKHHYAEHIIFTGGAAHNRFIEAKVMSELARSQGVPAANIVEELQANNTCQNAAYSVAIAQQRNWHSAIIVTSPNHLKRSSYLFSRYSLNFVLASSGYPAEMNWAMRRLFEQWEQYALTRIAAFGYPKC